MEEEEEGQSSLTEAQQDYKYSLDFLQQNKADSVSFGCRLDESQWTIEQWKGFLTALLKNTSVVTLIAGIHVLPVECLALLTDFIHMAQNLKDLTIQYTPQDNGDESSEISEKYRSKIDDILGAVRGNPAIKKLALRCLGNDPQSIQDLLTGNDTLETFTLTYKKYEPLSRTMARSIAAGLQENKELREIGLFVRTGHLDIIVSGLSRRHHPHSSSLESLSLWTYQPESNPELGLRVLEAIRFCPSLKKLVVKKPYGDWRSDEWTAISSQQPHPAQPWVDYVLKNLHHPDCAGLEALWLGHLTLGMSQENDYMYGDTVTAADWIVPIDQANKTLQNVSLEGVTFVHEQTVQLFYNLRGLKGLHVSCLSFLNGQSDENMIFNHEGEDNGENNGDIAGAAVEESKVDELTAAGDCGNNTVEEAEDDGNHGENNNGTAYWAQFIRQCIDLRQAHINVVHNIDIGYRSLIIDSILNGSRGHNSLEELKLQMHDEVEIPGGRLRALLQQLLLETTCLKCLEIDDIGHHDDLAAGLAGGLRSNKSLEKLVFEMYNTDDDQDAAHVGPAAGPAVSPAVGPSNPDAPHIITILDSLLQNDTLRHLSDDTVYDFRDVWDSGGYNSLYNGDDSHDICMALAGVFLVNTSLNHISLPSLDLQQGRMRCLLEGLGHNRTLTSLDMSNCQTDAPGFTLLQQALVDDKTIPLDHIVLPCFSKEHSVGSLPTDIKDFFQSLVRMRRVKTVDFDNSSWPIIDNETEDRVNCLKLLLHAAKENKYIQSFGSLDGVEENESCIELFSDIDYHLKLNCFGRHGLDSTNIRLSLWPAILAPMTTKAEDTDALFFFIREYFMRHSYPLRRQREQKLPLPKRARRLEHA